MARNILITGASGYLGGDMLEEMQRASMPSHGTIYALVRTEEQAKQVKAHYGATPISLDLSDESKITSEFLDKEISIVFFLINAASADTQLLFINALSAVGQKLHLQTHFLHTSGAKVFSSFTGHPTDRPLSDGDPQLFEIQKNAKSDFAMMKGAVNANCAVIEAAEARGVRSYIFIPCIVYGKSKGFGNPISIQTRAIVEAAKGTRQVCKPDRLDGVWPVCNVHDNSTLFLELLRKIIDGEDIPFGKQGYYLASSGTVRWTDIYAAMARSLHKRGVVHDPHVGECNDQALSGMAAALNCPKEWVPVQMGGKCTLHADRGKLIGWSPEYAPAHILDAADAEVELLLQHV